MVKKYPCLFWIGSIIAYFSLCVNYCFASGLQISPIRINVSEKQRVASFTITNMNSEKVLLQGRVNRWQQKKGKDIYSPSQDLILAPPIISILPGESQIFRVAIRNYTPSLNELSYRIFIQEVIPTVRRKDAGLHFSLRIGLPVFIAPIKTKPWQVSKTVKGIRVKGSNLSNTHVQVSHIMLIDEKNKKPVINKKVFHYLLPGQSYTWMFASKKKAKRFFDSIHLSKLKATTDVGILDSSITVS